MTLTSPVRVLVVEDSATVRRLLVQMLTQDPDIEIVGTAADGQTAIDMIHAQRPDVVTMDINMPGIDGLEATRRIMASCPVPIIIVSAAARPEEVQLNFDALEAGAVAVLEKPYAPGHPEHGHMSQRLRQMVRLMSEVKVVQRRIPAPRRQGEAEQPRAETSAARRAPFSPPSLTPASTGLPTLTPEYALRVVAIGASTGGPPALRLLLEGLSPDLPVALAIVQHIAPGFLDGMLAWLSQSTSFELRVASEGDILRPGLALFAPDGAHLCLTDGNRVTLSTMPPVNGARPSVSVLFNSVARHCGARGAGILLTGMGRDGAAELGQIAAAGGLTIAQDQASSVVHGMPGEALRLGHAQSILPPEKMPQAIAAWAGGVDSHVSLREVAKPMSHSSASADPAAGLRPLRIFLVEDSPTQTLRLRHALEQRNCLVETAEDGEAALHVLEAAHKAGQPPPDAIVSDILMPHIGGYELCRRLKSDPRWASIPVILLTSLGDPSDLIRGLECGADSFVVKPCEVDHLLAQIGRLIRDSESAANSSQSADSPNFCFAGECYRISATVPQVLRFLIASYEEARHRAERLDEANRALMATQEELEARKRELEQLNATKNQFLGMAAHDLRNPLDVVRGYAELLVEDVSDRLSQEELRMLYQIRASSNYMLALVNDLLDVSKIESGTLELRCQPTDLVQFVSNNLTTQRLFAERKKIELVFHAEPGLPPVSLDPSKADQVLNNLIGNALKFSPLGSRVTVSVRRLVSQEANGLDREWVEIAVLDSGPGIPPGELENIFKPFRSAGARATGGESSSGLGLAIAHRIVECHGGKITAENAPQGGSLFRVILPVAKEQKEEPN